MLEESLRNVVIFCKISHSKYCKQYDIPKFSLQKIIINRMTLFYTTFYMTVYFYLMETIRMLIRKLYNMDISFPPLIFYGILSNAYMYVFTKKRM